MATTDPLAILVTATFQELRDTTDTLLHNWQTRAQQAEAELEAVRARVLSLYRGEYMPTVAAVERALYGVALEQLVSESS